MRTIWSKHRLIALLLAIAAFGCSTSPKHEKKSLRPADFVKQVEDTSENIAAGRGEAYAAAPTRADMVVVAAVDVPQEPEPAIEPLEVSTMFLVDGMVGQVNGQPIYASTVLSDIDEQLDRLGSELPRSIFRQRAAHLINQRLLEIVINRLILGEAERDLSAQQQRVLKNMIKELREQVIRNVGGGIPTITAQKLRQSEGLTLDEKIEEVRKHIVIDRYLKRKLNPKIYVSRRDIERYYQEHIDAYVSPSGRVIRLLVVSSLNSADRVDGKLRDGVPFVELAESRMNQYKRGAGGREEIHSTDERFFAIGQLNEQVAKLRPGEHSSRITHNERYYWVYVESVKQAKGKSLQEAHLDIRRHLEFQQRQRLTQQYNKRLLADVALYDDVDEMSQILLKITMSRYAKPQ